MTDTDTNSSTEQTATGEQQFAIQRIYVKDLSFETPNSPAVFKEKWEPKVDVELNSKANKLGDNIFEVVLSVTVTATVTDKTAYLAEVQQAGIFTIAGFKDAEINHMIGSFCPNILFPYTREVISDLVTKGSFPQMVLSPVNFDALFQQHAQQATDNQEEPVH
ncbi:MAG: protein-export chaperone SecB [Gammaproteobacteria bacterium]|nr:protein-export chaperone SecB [Gammaproteobacteria bacterium]